MTCWLLRARGRVALAVSLAFSVFSIPAGAQNLDSGYCQLAPITDTRVGFAGREIVREVVVELGQRVARDDVLVRLDPAGLPARLDRARAELRQAERAMDRANALEGCWSQKSVTSAKPILQCGGPHCGKSNWRCKG